MINLGIDSLGILERLDAHSLVRRLNAELSVFLY